MTVKPIKRAKLPPVRDSVSRHASSGSADAPPHPDPHAPVSPPPPPPSSSGLDEDEKQELRDAFSVPDDDPGDGYIPPQYPHELPERGEAPSVQAALPGEDVTLGDLQATSPPKPARPSSVIASQFSDVPLPPPDLTVPPVPKPTPEVFRTPAPPPVAALPDWITTGSIGREVVNRVIPPTPSGRYVARIEILDVYQYPGTLSSAPEWIDRNWTAYADQDETRHPPLPGGPALAIPGAGLCRRGWYVVREVVTIEEGMTSERLAVYEPDVFYHWFRPATP